jgi:hypothetical protein
VYQRAEAIIQDRVGSGQGRLDRLAQIGEGKLYFADTKKFPAIFAQSVGRQLPDTALQNKPRTKKF